MGLGNMCIDGSRTLHEISDANSFGKLDWDFNARSIFNKNVVLLMRELLQMQKFHATTFYRELCAIGGAFNITGLMVGSFFLSSFVVL